MSKGGDGARFVGRERELAAVVEAYRASASGRLTALLIAADSGLGASRLVDEALASIAIEPAVATAPIVARADTLPAWRGAPYRPIRTALECALAGRPPAEVLDLIGPGAGVLLPLLPRVAAEVQLAGGAPSGPSPAAPAGRERLTERIHEAVRGVLGRLAGQGPVILVVEDLHVLDSASRALLAFLARTLGGRPVLVIGTYQPDALGRGHPLRATIEAIDAGPRPARRLELGPLDRAALRALIEAREGEPPSAPVLLLVAERSGGNPLIAEEVLAARRELSSASLTVPLDQLVVARACLRTPECRRVLRALSVADGPLTPSELAAVTAAYDADVARPAPRSPGAPRRSRGGLTGDLAAGVVEAVDGGFAEIVPDGLAGHSAPTDRARSRPHPRLDHLAGPIRIRHELVAAALAADLLPTSRRRMHAAVAAALVDHPAEAGRHWHEAHEARRQVLAEIAAAAEGEAVGAVADARDHLERAIELTGAPAVVGLLSEADELDLLLRAADASAGAGDTGRAVAFVELAIARQPDARDRAARAALTERLGAFRLAGGDRAGALAAFERTLELLPADSRVDRARVLATIAQVRMLEGSFSEAERVADEAIAAATDAGPEARGWFGHATCTLGVLDGWLGRPEPAIARLEAALDIATELGRLDDAFRARANLTTVLDIVGRREDGVEIARRGIEASEASGLEVAHGNLLRGNAADLLVSLGRWREARELAEHALDWAPAGTPFVNAALELATIETETTAGDAAARLLGRLFLELETIPDSQFAAPTFQAAASLALWRGDTADALRAAQNAWDRVRRTEDWALAARIATTALAVADARASEAIERHRLSELASLRGWSDTVLHDAARLVADSGVAPGSRLLTEAEADLATARAYAARIHGRDAAALWAGAAARWRAVGRPYDEARALHREAEAHLAAGARAGARREGREDAREPLLRATGIALELGAMPLLRALADVAARARIPLEDAAIAALAAEPSPAPPPDEVARAGAPRASVAARGSLVGRGAASSRGSEPASDGDAASAGRRTAASFGLSPREQGVLAEIVAGRTNREIGRRLFISDKTVGVHVGNILAKLGVGGRVEAATVALRLGLVDELVESAGRPPGRGLGGGRARRAIAGG